MPTVDMLYRFLATDSGAAAAMTGLSEKARVAATATQDLTAAQLHAADAEKLAADAATRSADLRLRASAALSEANERVAAGDTEGAAAAREAADALKLQATAAAATSRELNANATAAARQAAVIRSARDATVETESRFGGLSSSVGTATGVFGRFGGPVASAAADLAKVAIGADLAGTAIAVESIKSAASFQAATTRIHTQANVSVADTKTLSAGFLNMAASVASTPDELADAGYHIASIGQNSLSTAQQLNVLKIASEGAKLGGADLTDVTNALDAAVVSGIKGTQDYSQAMGALNATVGAGDMSMQDLADAMSTGVLASMKGYGVSLRQVGAALATFGDNNIRGAKAGTDLRMAVQALAVPTLNGGAMLQDMGIKAGNLSKQLEHGGLTDALDTLMQKLRASGVTAKEQGDVLTEMFGKKAGVGLNVLMDELDRFHNKLGEVGKGSGSFDTSWTAYTKTFEYNLKSAEAAVDVLKVKLGNELLPDATKALHWLATDGVADLTRFGHWFEANAHVIGDFTYGVIQAFRLMVDDILMQFKPLIDGIGKAFGWLPGIGGKIKAATSAFDGFYSSFNSKLNAAANDAKNAGDRISSNYAAGLRSKAADMAHLAQDNLLQPVLGVFAAGEGKSATSGSATGQGYASGVGSKKGAASSAGHSVAGSATSAMTGGAGAAKAAGEHLGAGYVAGIDAYRSLAMTAGEELADSATSAIARRQISQSPSKVTMKHGSDAAKGYAIGITDGTSGAEDAAAKMTSKVVDATSSTAKTKAKTIELTGAQIAKGIINGFTGALDTSGSQLSMHVRHILTGLHTDVETETKKLEAQVKTAQQALKSVEQNRASAASSIAQGIEGDSSISNATDPDSGAVTNIGTYLSGQAANAMALQSAESQLKKMGLNTTLLSQIAGDGSTNGLAEAQSILSGQSGSIANLNKYQHQINAAANATGQTVANSEYAGQIAKQTAHLDAIEKHEAHIEDLLGDIAKSVAATAASGGTPSATAVKKALKNYGRKTGQPLLAHV
jgi:TP901 family phage tail tape measure protein